MVYLCSGMKETNTVVKNFKKSDLARLNKSFIKYKENLMKIEKSKNAINFLGIKLAENPGNKYLAEKIVKFEVTEDNIIHNLIETNERFLSILQSLEEQKLNSRPPEEVIRTTVFHLYCVYAALTKDSDFKVNGKLQNFIVAAIKPALNGNTKISGIRDILIDFKKTQKEHQNKMG